MVLVFLAILLSVLDAYSTYKVISRGGKELNPIMAKLIERVGLVKAMIPVVLVKPLGIYLLILNGWSGLAMILVGVIALVVANNFRHLMR